MTNYDDNQLLAPFGTSSITNEASFPQMFFRSGSITVTYEKNLTVKVKNDIGDGNFGSYFNIADYHKKMYRFGDIVKVAGYYNWNDRFVYAGFLRIKYPDDSVHLM
jgi:hypothetical protein